MFTRRGVSAASALALSLIVAGSPVDSAPSTIVGTVVKQSAPIAIDTCTAAVDGDVYTPSVALHPDARVAVVQTFALTFVDANGKTTGHALVTPPFAPAIADGGAFAAMKCEISELRLDDGTTFSDAKPERDSHAFVNAFIGVGILAAIGFVASRNDNSGSAPASSATPVSVVTASPTATPTALPSGATAQPSSNPTAVALGLKARPTATPSPSVAVTARPEAVAPPLLPRRR